MVAPGVTRQRRDSSPAVSRYGGPLRRSTLSTSRWLWSSSWAASTRGAALGDQCRQPQDRRDDADRRHVDVRTLASPRARRSGRPHPPMMCSPQYFRAKSVADGASGGTIRCIRRPPGTDPGPKEPHGPLHLLRRRLGHLLHPRRPLVVGVDRRRELLDSPETRRLVGGVYLTFLLPGVMGLFAQVDPGKPGLWRTTFGLVALLGAWSTFRLIRADRHPGVARALPPPPLARRRALPRHRRARASPPSSRRRSGSRACRRPH